jgi:tetratricopeptide (TPR) repeat protein
MYEAFQPLMAKSRTEDLIEALRRVTLLFPGLARAHNDLGVQYYRAGQKPAARDHYARAVALAPRDIVFLKNLADYCYVEEQRTEEALRLYVRVLEIDPRDVETLTVTGHICVSVKKFEDAKVFYGRVLEIEPWNAEVRGNLEKLDRITAGSNAARSPRALYEEALALSSGGNFPAAIQALEGLLKVDPRFAPAHNDLGVLLYRAGDRAGALPHYEAAARLEPENLTFQKNLADFYFVEQQRFEDALRLYVGILEKEPQDIEALTATARICEALGLPEDAEVFYRRVMEIEPWNAEAGRRLDELSRRPSAPPQGMDAAAMHAEACRLAAGGRNPEAIEALERLAAAFPDFALGQNDLGVLYGRAGQLDAALRHYERAVALEPENLLFKKNLADHLWVKLGRVRDALSHYVDILAVQPEDLETLMATGLICQALKQYDDARHFYNRVVEIEPWNAEVREHLAALDGAERAAA